MVEPLAEKRYRVEFTADAGLVAKLERAKGLLRHRSPHLDEAEVVDRALDALLTQLEKQKFGKVDRPRACKDSDSRYVPADVRRQVYERDGGRCTFVSASGKRCDETAFVEYDHIVPVAHGGRSTVDNFRIRCRTHNQYTARLQLGTRAREASARYRIPGWRSQLECADAPKALDTLATSSPEASSDNRSCPDTSSRPPGLSRDELPLAALPPRREPPADHCPGASCRGLPGGPGTTRTQMQSRVL